MSELIPDRYHVRWVGGVWGLWDEKRQKFIDYYYVKQAIEKRVKHLNARRSESRE